MKAKLYAIGATLLAIGSTQAGVTFGSTTAVGLKDNTGATNAAAGSLVMLIVDDGNNGFLNTSNNGAITPGGSSALTATVDPGVTAANAGITSGGRFGGDLILGTFSMNAGGSVAAALNNVSIAGLEGKPFALVWFTQSGATLGSGVAGANYGIASGADWTLPTTDSGTYSFNGTTNPDASVYWQLGSSTTAAQVGSTGFFTGSGTAGSNAIKGAVFQVVPEPSVALLSGLGLLGLLRRRRN